jgi:hypothetical protein
MAGPGNRRALQPLAHAADQLVDAPELGLALALRATAQALARPLLGTLIQRLQKQAWVIDHPLANAAPGFLVVREPLPQFAGSELSLRLRAQQAIGCALLARDNGATTCAAAQLDNRPSRTAAIAASVTSIAISSEIQRVHSGERTYLNSGERQGLSGSWRHLGRCVLLSRSPTVGQIHGSRRQRPIRILVR